MKAIIFTSNSEIEYSQDAIKSLKGGKYAIVQSSENNRMAVQIVNEKGFADWDYFGGAGRTQKAREEALRWVK